MSELGRALPLEREPNSTARSTYIQGQLVTQVHREVTPIAHIEIPERTEAASRRCRSVVANAESGVKALQSCSQQLGVAGAPWMRAGVASTPTERLGVVCQQVTRFSLGARR
jgi:hypothetical protein